MTIVPRRTRALTPLPPTRIARLAALGVLASLAACANPSDRELRRLTLRVDSLARAVTALGRAAGRVNGAPPALRTAATRITGSLRDGDPKAPLVLVEFTDYFCPFCATFAITTLPELAGAYARSVGLEIVVRNYPIKEIHPQATRVASMVECAIDASPDAGWALYRQLYAKGETLDSIARDRLVRSSGVPPVAAEKCLGGRTIHRRVLADAIEASRLGIRGTPSFVLGRRIGADSVAGVLLDGAYPAKEIKRLIDSLRTGME